MAGGSLPDIRSELSPDLLKLLPDMQPAPSQIAGQYVLHDDYSNTLIFNAGRFLIRYNLPAAKYPYELRWIDARTGEMTQPIKVTDTENKDLKAPNGQTILWIKNEF
jgi:hypothetical protein